MVAEKPDGLEGWQQALAELLDQSAEAAAELEAASRRLQAIKRRQREIVEKSSCGRTEVSDRGLLEFMRAEGVDVATPRARLSGLAGPLSGDGTTRRGNLLLTFQDGVVVGVARVGKD